MVSQKKNNSNATLCFPEEIAHCFMSVIKETKSILSFLSSSI